MEVLQDNLISLVMRTVGGRPREIRRALNSVSANHYRPIEVVVVYQGNDSDEMRFLKALPDEFSELTIRILQNAAIGDRRAENLNIGWEVARGRYLGFLDDDDTLEPQHCGLLLNALQNSGHMWSYSQATLRKENEQLAIVAETQPFRRHRFSVAELWTENFLPIHSFLVDRANLVSELRERPFCENLDRSEDWDFLIRLGFFHEPEVVDVFTCNYYVSTGSRNTNLSLMESEDAAERRQEHNRVAWARCKELVEQRKMALLQRVWWARELFNGAVPPAEGPDSTEISVNLPGLRRRIVRALIRRLERLL
jgi:glycosyltransferase involved in cell wall biosynthesis